MTEAHSQDAAEQKAARTRNSEQERRLRHHARACGFELISPYGYHPGYIGEPHRAYALVAHNSGMTLDEVERVLKEKKENGNGRP